MSGSTSSDIARRGQLVAATLLAAMVLVGALIALGSFGGDDPASDASVVDGVRGVEESTELLEGIPQRGITLGDPQAPVTIVTFADLKCSACRAYALGPQPKVIRDLVRTGKASIELRLIAIETFGRDDQDARTAVHHLAATDQAWPMVELLYYNQGSGSEEWVDETLLAGFARVSPMLRGATIDLQPDDATRELDETADYLAEKLQITGTPMVFVRPTGDERPEAYRRVDVPRFDDPAQAIADAVAEVQRP